MSAVAKQIARPALMRGMVAKDTKMGLIGAAITGVVSSVLYKVFVYDARKKQYAEHYRTYDPYADFERMAKAGIFQSVNADMSVNTEGW